MVRFRLASFSQIIFLSERYETEQNRREWGGEVNVDPPMSVLEHLIRPSSTTSILS